MGRFRRFINGAMKVFAYLVVALCVASTLAVVELDSSLDSIDQHNEDLIEIAETGGVSGARQRVSLDLGEEEAADDMLQRGEADKEGSRRKSQEGEEARAGEEEGSSSRTESKEGEGEQGTGKEEGRSEEEKERSFREAED